MTERTFGIIKPDATGAKQTGAILEAIQKSGLDIVGLKMLHMSQEQASEFYAVHQERPFYQSLVNFMASGPVTVYVLEGENAIKRYRDLMGATNPEEAAEGTLRARFATSIDHNAVHGSDAPETAAQEIAFFFKDDELFNAS